MLKFVVFGGGVEQIFSKLASYLFYEFCVTGIVKTANKDKQQFHRCTDYDMLTTLINLCRGDC